LTSICSFALSKPARKSSAARTVLSIEKEGSTGWIVNSVYTNADLRSARGSAENTRAQGRAGRGHAGLKRDPAALAWTSDCKCSDAQLGKRCSTNGDMLIADYATSAAVHTVADETVKPSTRAIGPTITGVIDLRATAGVRDRGNVGCRPGCALRFTEIFATVNMLHGIAENDSSQHTQGFPNDDLYVAPATRVEHSALYAVMGDDGAAGSIEIKATRRPRTGTASRGFAGISYKTSGVRRPS